jgi:5-methylcytosine-specific restriction endonuclease McrA
MRAAQLSKEPLCAGCLAGGIVTAADTVDHVFPWQQIGEHSFYRNMFQSLCVSCHTLKTAMEKRGVFRRYGKPSHDYIRGDYSHVMAEIHGE